MLTGHWAACHRQGTEDRSRLCLSGTRGVIGSALPVSMVHPHGRGRKNSGLGPTIFVRLKGRCIGGASGDIN
jgi:hypothetical protein